jgi:hypothetical protein
MKTEISVRSFKVHVMENLRNVLVLHKEIFDGKFSFYCSSKIRTMTLFAADFDFRNFQLRPNSAN